MKPILKYRGGKSKEIIHFNDYIPNDFETYFEPFFGGGALYFHLQPQQAVINDINTKLINFYSAIKNDFQIVKSDLRHIQNIYDSNRLVYEERKRTSPEIKVPDDNEDFYYQLRDMYNELIPSTYHEAALYYFINKTAYSGMIRYNSKGEFNVPYGRYKNFNTELLTNEHNLLLQNTSIFNGSYIDIFNRVSQNDFVFLDPPYDTEFSDYGNIEFNGDFKEDEHRVLAQDFRHLSGRALMIIGSTPLIEELYAPFIKDRYSKSYAVNIRNRFKAESEHLIITNY